MDNIYYCCTIKIRTSYKRRTLRAVRNMSSSHKTQNYNKDGPDNSVPSVATSDDVKSEKTENPKSSLKGGVGAHGKISSGQRLYLALSRHRHMSLLSSEHYYAHHFWYTFLPSIRITMMSAIFAFATKSEFCQYQQIQKVCLLLLLDAVPFSASFVLFSFACSFQNLFCVFCRCTIKFASRKFGYHRQHQFYSIPSIYRCVSSEHEQ